MAYQEIEKLLCQAGGSRYKLAVLAAKRAVELAEGMPKLIEKSLSNKPATLALEEIAQKKVELGPMQEEKKEVVQEKKEEKKETKQEEKKEEKQDKKKDKKKGKKTKGKK